MTSTDTIQPAVVLVADRTLSADYTVLFEAIFATMQTTQTPAWLMRRLLSPAAPADPTGRAVAAPLGLRRIEAALLANGLDASNVVIATPETLPRLLGPWTKIVAVSSSDPLGRGMSNTTTANFAGDGHPLYTQLWTDQLMQTVRATKERFGFAVVAGGAGAWQYAADPDAVSRHAIDLVFEGYFESRGPAIFAEILAGRLDAVRDALPCGSRPNESVASASGPPPSGVVREQRTCTGDVQPIRGRSLLGAIELSRGCGKGCRFCYAADRPMEHLPVDLILADIQTNLVAGQRSVVSTSEDFFRYGTTGSKVNFAALRDLLSQVRQLPGLSFMQIDHANISSVMQLSDDELREVRRLLAWNRRTDYLWVNLGVESASGLLVAANSAAKIAPFDPADWDELVRASADKLERTGFFPVYSLVLGLPGETPDDVTATRALVDFLATKRAVVFPIFHEPMHDAGGRFTLADLRADHLELFAACYAINFRQVPALYADNQRAGGVPWIKRAIVQVLGRGEVFTWRRKFRRLRKQLARQGR